MPFKSPKFKIKKGSSVRKTFLLYKPDGMMSDPSHLCAKPCGGHTSVISVLGRLAAPPVSLRLTQKQKVESNQRRRLTLTSDFHTHVYVCTRTHIIVQGAHSYPSAGIQTPVLMIELPGLLISRPSLQTPPYPESVFRRSFL